MLLQALYDFYQRACRDGLIEEAAFTKKYVRWTIPLKADGTLEGVGLIENPKLQKGGREFTVPRTGRPKGSGQVAEFLSGELEAVFGLDREPNAAAGDLAKRARIEANNKAKHEDFWQQIEEAAQETNSSALLALLRFRDQNVTNPQAANSSFLRWGLNQDGANDEPCWWVKNSLGKEIKLGPDNFTFQVDGFLLLDDETVIRPHWRTTFIRETEAKEKDAVKGLCLVTGKNNVPILKSHLPKIKKVPGTKQAEVFLVSAYEDAFWSYGLEQGLNAPVSLEAVRAYCNALNFLLSNEKHRLKVGGTALCFWAKESEAINDLFAQLFEQPKPQAVRSFLATPFKGDADYTPLKEDQFYSVTLTGNAGRIIVRHWMQKTVEQAVKNFRLWFEHLQIAEYRPIGDDEIPLSLKSLARTTLRITSDRKYKDEDLKTEIVTQLYRAALEGTAPSLLLARSILERFKADLAKNGLSALNNLSRFALLRLIINRNEKEKTRMIDPIISETDDYAYNCGRLLAIFDDLQMAAHDYKLEGAGVVERYYGTASSAPNSAFGILWRLHQHHLKKLSRGDSGKAKAESLKKKIEDIAKLFKQPQPNLPPQFPRSFNLQEQGRFALGFYQQKAAERAGRQAHIDAKKAQAATQQTNTEGESTND